MGQSARGLWSNSLSCPSSSATSKSVGEQTGEERYTLSGVRMLPPSPTVPWCSCFSPTLSIVRLIRACTTTLNEHRPTPCISVPRPTQKPIALLPKVVRTGVVLTDLQ